MTSAPTIKPVKLFFFSGDGSQLARAESCFRKYVTQPPEGKSPDLAAAHWRLGLVLEKENRKDDARKELQTAVGLDPNFREAQKDLKRLK